ncbi:hypothetical protein GQ43DRAFT_431410 [Delitschia confertaspora ATCC 74209]|uniref:Anaphase-promoting complex subunit 11 n=1 Tax=Delitschia confertaspora ATCC 74209 TaxID=1513339 RepID=A0A9P4MSR0_9PLEO|nr:hypothetical protein GQ43DRAFT_431410 [Delitschia confertaspora ATCC 74209]
MADPNFGPPLHNPLPGQMGDATQEEAQARMSRQSAQTFGVDGQIPLPQNPQTPYNYFSHQQGNPGPRASRMSGPSSSQFLPNYYGAPQSQYGASASRSDHSSYMRPSFHTHLQPGGFRPFGDFAGRPHPTFAESQPRPIPNHALDCGMRNPFQDDTFSIPPPPMQHLPLPIARQQGYLPSYTNPYHPNPYPPGPHNVHPNPADISGQFGIRGPPAGPSQAIHFSPAPAPSSREERRDLPEVPSSAQRPSIPSRRHPPGLEMGTLRARRAERADNRSTSPRTSHRRSYARFANDASTNTENLDPEEQMRQRRRRLETMAISQIARHDRMRASFILDPNAVSGEQIRRFRERLIRRLPSELPEGASRMCDICQKDYSTIHVKANEDEEVAIELPCKHIFGEHCINTWFETCKSHKNKITCPMCREELIKAPTGLHRGHRAMYFDQEALAEILRDDLNAEEIQRVLREAFLGPETHRS